MVIDCFAAWILQLHLAGRGESKSAQGEKEGSVYIMPYHLLVAVDVGCR